MFIIAILALKTVSVIFFDTSLDNEVHKEIPTENVCVVLNYHRIRNETIWDKFMKNFLKSDELTKYSISTEVFKSQIDELIENDAYFATLAEFEEFKESGNFPEKCVLITFDDADETTYTNAYPYLKEKGIPFTVYVIAGQVGNTDFNNLRLATWDQLREMRDSNLVTFGSHTYDMHYLEDNKALFLHEDESDEFFEDIVKSKVVLEENLGVKINSIAYPFGHASDLVTEKVIEAKFETAFILAPNPVRADNSPYYLDRYLITEYNFDDIVTPWLSAINEKNS